MQSAFPPPAGFYGVSVTNNKGIVIMEYAEGRDLQSALQVRAAGSSQRLFSWQRRGRRVAFELAKVRQACVCCSQLSMVPASSWNYCLPLSAPATQAINYLHSKEVIHFDIKSQVSYPGTASVRVAGGWSRNAPEQQPRAPGTT